MSEDKLIHEAHLADLAYKSGTENGYMKGLSEGYQKGSVEGVPIGINKAKTICISTVKHFADLGYSGKEIYQLVRDQFEQISGMSEKEIAVLST